MCGRLSSSGSRFRWWLAGRMFIGQCSHACGRKGSIAGGVGRQRLVELGTEKTLQSCCELAGGSLSPHHPLAVVRNLSPSKAILEKDWFPRPSFLEEDPNGTSQVSQFLYVINFDQQRELLILFLRPCPPLVCPVRVKVPSANLASRQPLSHP